MNGEGYRHCVAAPLIRKHEIGPSTLVVTLAGELDRWTAELLATALGDAGSRTVIVDLLAARDVGRDVQDAIFTAARGSRLIVVADPQLLHVFQLRQTSMLGFERSLAAAVAACN